MKKLTKKQYGSLGSFAGSNDVNHGILKNGELGQCEPKKTVVICCSNCGNYERIKYNLEIK